MQSALQLRKAIAPMRHLAERLIAHETTENNPSATKTKAMFPVSEKLRASLVALVGTTGFAALLSRALVLASVEVAWLRAVHVKADGALEGLEGQVDPEKLAQGQVVLFTELLELLEAFIGENLTMQIVRDIWPKLFPNDAGRGD